MSVGRENNFSVLKVLSIVAIVMIFGGVIFRNIPRRDVSKKDRKRFGVKRGQIIYPMMNMVYRFFIVALSIIALSEKVWWPIAICFILSLWMFLYVYNRLPYINQRYNGSVTCNTNLRK
jgi:hypothetical protein